MRRQTYIQLPLYTVEGHQRALTGAKLIWRRIGPINLLYWLSLKAGITKLVMWKKRLFIYFASADKNACTIDVNVSFLKTDDVDVVAVVSLCYVPDDA